ncbi:MAG: radical SAM protein [Myxococcota bacterium]
MRNRVRNPPNRHDGLDVEWEVEPPKARLRIVEDHSAGVLTHNRSPDIDFDWSVNPYRGCTHACAYCYARRTHEDLGYGAGSDFERVIVVKPRAPELLAEALAKPRWKGERIAFSGVTDCYQPLERRYLLTRRCLATCARVRNPVTIVTRSPLVLRDLDVLAELHQVRAVGITISVPVTNRVQQAALEPGAPPVDARFEAIARLAQAGLPVGISIGPVIAGLNDRDIPRTLQRAREAGASWAWFGALRLPGAVRDVFERRLDEALPLAAPGIRAKIARTVTGSSAFHARSAGNRDDASWRATEHLFRLWHTRLGYGPRWQPPVPSPFRRERAPESQLALFG